MELLRRLYNLYSDLNLNPATLSGAIDVIVVRQPDGSLKASPFHVRFGKLNLLRSKKQRFVRIRINGEAVDLKMCVGPAGECYFMDEEAEDGDEGLALSPLPATGSGATNHSLLSYGGASSLASSLASSPPISMSPKMTDDEDNVPTSPTSAALGGGGSSSVSGAKAATREIEEWEWGNLPVSEPVDAAGVPIPPGTASGSQSPNGNNNNNSNYNGSSISPAATLAAAASKLGSSSDSADDTAVHAATTTTTAASALPTTIGKGNRPPPLTIPQDALASSFHPATAASPTAAATTTTAASSASTSAATSTATTPTASAPPRKGWMKNISELFSHNKRTVEEDDEAAIPEGGVLLSQLQPVDDEYSTEEEEDEEGARNNNNNNHMGIHHHDSLPSIDTEDLDNISFHSTHEDFTMEAGSSSSSRSASPTHGSTQDLTETGHPHSISNAVMIPRPAHLSPTDISGPAPLSASLPHTLAHAPAPLVTSSSLSVRDPVLEMLLSQPGSLPSSMLVSRSESIETLRSEPSTGAQQQQQQQQQAGGIPYQVSMSLCGGLGASSAVATSTASISSSGVSSSSAASSAVGSPSTTPVPPAVPAAAATMPGLVSVSKEAFERHLVTHEQLQKNPTLLSHPDLVVRVNNAYLTWPQAAPLIMSWVLFQRPLIPGAQATAQLAEEPKKPSKGWSSWWSWGRREDTASKATVVGASDISSTSPVPGSIASSVSSVSSIPATAGSTSTKPLTSSVASAGTAATSPAAAPTSSTAATVVAAIATAAPDSDEAKVAAAVTGDDLRPTSPFKRSKKGLRLSSEQLMSLNLKDGANVCEFSFVTKLQGKATVQCMIYLWDHSDRVVISDIDGTITRSDVLGHAAALVGTDWTQMGVASLFSSVEKNGYRFLYLSSRSISHAGPTRAYVKGVKQQDFQLPDGPIMLSPASLFQSLHREVILRKPEVFKIACLQDILSLFPEGSDHTNPFTAGFGNRNTDVISYQAVGIHSNRIFIIDPRGLVKVPSSAFRSSYSKLNDIVNEMFPPVHKATTHVSAHKQYGSFEYWHQPPQMLSAEELALVDM